MKTRILAGLTVLLLVVLALTMPVRYFYILYFALAMLCCYEFMHMLETTGKKPMKSAAYVWTAVYTFLLYNHKYELLWNSRLLEGHDFMIAATLLFMILITIAVFSKKFDFESVAYTLAGCIYAVVLFSFAVLIIEQEFGKWLLGYVILGGVATDTFSYFTGYFLGKRKIIPNVSPKKTIEGSIGGYVGCAVILLAYSFIVKSITGEMMNTAKLLVIILTTGAIAQIGDWCASYIKRYFNIKDFGKLIPGHGGILDRVDSIIFLAPVMYLIFII